MARHKSEDPHVPVKVRVNLGLMDRLTALAAQQAVTVPKLLAGIMESTLADLPDPYDYELHDMTETYALTKNSNFHLSANRMNLYMRPQVNEVMKDMARYMNCDIGSIRTSFILDHLDTRGML